MIHTLTQKNKLTKNALDFFGSGVQDFGLWRESLGVYTIVQLKNCGRKEVFARVEADCSESAARKFNRIAEYPDGNSRMAVKPAVISVTNIVRHMCEIGSPITLQVAGAIHKAAVIQEAEKRGALVSFYDVWAIETLLK